MEESLLFSLWRTALSPLSTEADGKFRDADRSALLNSIDYLRILIPHILSVHLNCKLVFLLKITF
jgi:hypothetical protein